MKIERQFAEVRASGEDRQVKFIFSTDAKDRHGTRINSEGWRLDNFNKNGIASFQHRAYGDPDPDMIIGKAQAWESDGRLVGTIDFETEDVNPLADKLYKKVRAGTLNAVSVGFVEYSGHWGHDEEKRADGEDADTYYFDDIELMEISLVTVPSNPEALAYRAFESTGVQKWNRENSKVEVEVEVNGLTDSTVYTTGTGIEGENYIWNLTQTDLTKQVTKSINMEDEVKKDLPETSKVEVDVKIDATELNAAVDRLAETVKPPEPLPGAPAPELSEKDKKDMERYSIAKAILKKSQAQNGEGKLDGIELEMHQEAVRESRAAGREIAGLGVPSHFTRADLKATVDAQGGYTVATELPGFIDTLKNNMATVKAGATLMTGLEGDLSIPKLSSDSTATWRTEGGVATQSDPVFAAVTMTPHRLTTFTEFTNQLLRQSSLDIEAIVRNTLYYSIANALETAALEGSGTSQVPQGILNASVNDATHGSTAPTLASWSNIIDMEKMVAVDNALAAKMAFIVKSTAAAKLKTTTRDSTAGGYIWENDPLLGGTIDGYPAYVTNVYTDDSIIFGNWAELMIGQWGGIDLLVNPYSLDTYATVRVVIAGYYDVAVKHAESFARIDDLKL